MAAPITFLTTTDAERLSIIVPALNEAAGIARSLEAPRRCSARPRGDRGDGGSEDGTRNRRAARRPRDRRARPRAPDECWRAAAGGAALLFPHADTRLRAQIADFAL
jgi:hypothetical protein